MKILNDDGYRQLQRPEETEYGDIVVYHDEDDEPCHVGIVLRKNLAIHGENRDLLTVVSKWGADGEYIHDATKLPSLLGRPAQYTVARIVGPWCKINDTRWGLTLFVLSRVRSNTEKGRNLLSQERFDLLTVILGMNNLKQ